MSGVGEGVGLGGVEGACAAWLVGYYTTVLYSYSIYIRPL